VSAVRFLLVATVVIVAAFCTPAAIAPGLNSADAIVFAAPLALVVIVARPRRLKTPAGGATSQGVRFPRAASPAGSLTSDADNGVRS
jgi:hypothetical protein